MREQGAATAIAQAKQVYLAAAGVLLETGEGKGVGGTFLVAAGVALMREIEAVFAILDAKRLDDSAIRLLASELSQIVESPPATSAELDRALRDAFANLLQAARSPAEADASLWPWPEVADAPAPAWPDFARLGPEAEPLDALHKRCELAEQWIAFRPGARAMTRLVMEASWPLGREKQISAGVYRRWMTELTRGAGEVLAESTGASGLARLQRLATLGKVFSMLDALAPDPGAKQLEKALFEKVEIMPDDSAASDQDGLSRLEQWLVLAAARNTLIDDKQVVRQLRPAVRSIADLARRSQAEVFQSLLRVASDPDAAGDPGVMAAVNLYSENLDLLRLLQRASDAVADSGGPAGDPVARDSAKPFTDALLKLSKDVANARKRDGSLAGLRNLATDVADLQELPGERRLREKEPAIEAVVGAKGDDVLALIDRERAAWRRDVGAKAGAAPGGEVHAQKLRAVAVVLGLAVDAGRCKEIATDPGSPLLRWGGWWLDKRSLDRFASDALLAVPAMLESVEQGDPGSAMAAAEAGARAHAVVLLAARLGRELDTKSEVTFDDLTGLRAVATGTPDPQSVLLARWRPQLAAVCRYAEEGAAGNAEASAFASRRAGELLDAMKRNGGGQ